MFVGLDRRVDEVSGAHYSGREPKSFAMNATLLRELEQLLGPKGVLARPEDLMLYENDGSVEEGHPDCIVFPRSKQDVVEIVKLAARHDAPLVGRGAGTGLSGGALARRGGIVVTFSRMNRILQIDTENLRAVVEPGVVNLDLTREIESAVRSRGHTTRIIGADGAMKNLSRRARAANGTDLFVSVHHDSTREKFQATWIYEGAPQRYSDRFAGFSLFVSRENPAWRTALRCASAIGAALVKAGFKPSLYHADPVLGENRPFADKANGVHYFDHLAVLRRAAMPALLFEAGVIVNRDEEMKLRDSAVRERIAAGVAEGIETCLKEGKG